MATNTGTKTDYPFAKLRDMLRPGYGEGDQGIIHHKHVVGGLHVFPSVEKMRQMHASVREAGVLCYVVNVEADQIIINETYTLSDDLLTFIPCSFGKEGPAGKEVPSNIWIGATICNQAEADRDIPKLLATPAAKRFLSIEPMLGPVDLRHLLRHQNPGLNIDALTGWTTRGQLGMAPGECSIGVSCSKELPALDWIICGGESGPHARPMHPQWARSLRDQCASAGVPFLFKQWGEWAPQIGAVDGWTIDDSPEISKFDHLEWEDGKWGEVFRPMWCDFQDGNYDEDHTVSRIGKKRAGRLLDGVEHNGVPA
jgi:hypothetical protein